MLCQVSDGRIRGDPGRNRVDGQVVIGPARDGGGIKYSVRTQVDAVVRGGGIGAERLAIVHGIARGDGNAQNAAEDIGSARVFLERLAADQKPRPGLDQLELAFE